MSERAATLTLDGHSHFHVELGFHDYDEPDSSHTFDCIVDTGCGDAIAIPHSYQDNLSRFLSRGDRAGAGGKDSPIYGVVVTSVGEIELDHVTKCICSLRHDRPLGLIGIDLLRYMDVNIHDEPSVKKLDMDPCHF